MLPFIQGEDAIDDHSGAFHAVRGRLTDSHGRRYMDVVRTLRPEYGRVRRDIAVGYAMLAASVACACTLEALGAAWPLVIASGATLIGYWIAYLQLFIHEAAHYNLAATREANDRLCNVLIGWMIGSTAAQYRVVHFQHHRALGTVDDSEMTYFFPLNLGFLAETLLGIRALEVLVARRRLVGRADETRQTAKKTDPKPGLSKVLLAGVATHGAIVGALWLFAGLAPAIAWMLGVGMMFPFFGAVRQLLEHRDDHADADADYRAENHGAFTRMFGNDVFSASFGAVGFNRHLLHHWEPQVSYTNLPELERLLLDTEMRPVIEARRSGYAATFLRLLSLSSKERREAPMAEESVR